MFAFPADQQQLRRLLPVFKPKQREGVVERVEADGCTAVCRWVPVCALTSCAAAQLAGLSSLEHSWWGGMRGD